MAQELTTQLTPVYTAVDWSSGPDESFECEWRVLPDGRREIVSCGRVLEGECRREEA